MLSELHLNVSGRVGVLIALLALASSLAPSAGAQQCDTILRDGVYDRYEVNSTSYSAMTLAWRFSQMTAQEARQKIKATAGLTIKGLPANGEFTDDTFESWKQTVRQSLDVSKMASNESSILQLSASPSVLQTWLDCVRTRQGISWHLAPQGDEIVFFTTRFTPISTTEVEAKITTDATLSGGKFVSAQERNSLKRNARIGPNGVVAQIKRDDPKNPITLTINTTHGTIQCYVPGIVSIPDAPPAPKRPIVLAVRGNVGATCNPTNPPVGNQGQLRGERNPAARAGEWTEPMIVDADWGDGGVALQFAILDPDGVLPGGNVLRVGLFSEPGYDNGQCDCQGWQNIPVTRTEGLQNADWTPGFRINTDQRDGGCRLKFEVLSSAIKFSIRATAEEAGSLQIGDPGQGGQVIYDGLSVGQVADIRMNTDNTNGGGILRFRIDQN